MMMVVMMMWRRWITAATGRRVRDCGNGSKAEYGR
jgi:hypothetical protein